MRDSTPLHIHAHYSNSSSGETFEHPPYSPDLRPCDCHLFLHLKKFLAGQSMRSDQKTKAYKSWFHCMTSALMYMATMWRSSFCRHQHDAIKVFLKNL
jgi:hypothetical protein